MSRVWQEGVAVVVVLLGLGAGAFLVAQRPSFWLEFGVRLGRVLLPKALKYLALRMPPYEEAAWWDVDRRGRGDDPLKVASDDLLTADVVERNHGKTWTSVPT